MRHLLLILIIGLGTLPLVAQKPKVIKTLIETEFMHKLDSVRQRAQKSVRDFKAIQHMYTADEIQKVADAYDASAGLFNNILITVKEDLLNKEKRKFIKRFPEDYSKQMMADVYRARIFYETNYMVEITLVTNGQITGFAWLGSAITIFELVKEGWAILKKLQADWEGIKEQIIDNQLIEPYRFKLWEEL